MASAPNECCGYVLYSSLGCPETLRCANSAPNPQEGFLISANDQLDAIKTDRVIGLYHSHVTVDEKPSDGDKTMCEELELPYWCYSVLTDKLSKLEPTGVPTPIEGRKFLLGIHDCATLIIDYYHHKLGIDLPDFNADLHQCLFGFKNLMEYCNQAKLFKVDPPKPGDIVMMQIGKAIQPNHAGIYSEGGVLLHQLLKRKSEHTGYTGYWKTHTVFFLRHESKL